MRERSGTPPCWHRFRRPAREGPRRPGDAPLASGVSRRPRVGRQSCGMAYARTGPARRGACEMADDFVPGLEGVIAFETEIAEPDKDGGALRYRGVDIEDLVGKVTFGNVWALL